MKTNIVISFVVLVIAYAVYFSSSEKSATNESAITSVTKIAAAKLSAVAKAVKLTSPADDTTFDNQTAFEDRLNDIIDQLPTLNRASEPHADSENQIHGLQSEEFIEGHMLAKLRTLTLENEKFMASSQTAYAGCAERGDLSPSVRAICFMRAMEISIKLNNPQNIVELNVPADVRQLALRLVN